MASQRRMRPQRLRGVTGGDVPNPFACSSAFSAKSAVKVPD
jgi:hypothetical protein